MLNPYDELSAQRDATDAEIKHLYLEQVKRYPPEKDPERFKQIRHAYELIKDQNARLEHELFFAEVPSKNDLARQCLKAGTPGRLSTEQMSELMWQK